MSQLILTRNSRHSRKRNVRRAVNNEIIISPYSLMVVLLMFLGFSCLVQLMSSNQAAMKGYEIKRLDDQRRELLDINERGQNHLSELTSMAKVRENDVVQRMVRPRNVLYVRGDTAIALSE